ncbi:MAG: TIGR01459 family HAD-type hydrolase [Bauldia sp.]
MSGFPPLQQISGLSEVAGAYQFLLCDVWGVIHNGLEHFRPAGAALVRFRDRGGRVVLVSNAPRPSTVIRTQLDRLGVERAAYDDIVTSGDVSRDLLSARPGARIYSIGPERDLPIYGGLDVALVGEQEADLVACTGLFDDETETPDHYAELLRRLAARGLPMLCMNPDIVVERGDRLVWCAGALAQRYRLFGGETIVVGKPHPEIYAAALKRIEALAGRPVPTTALLAVGDGAETDIRGANSAGIDALFITGGIHATTFGERDRPSADAIVTFLMAAGLSARAFAPRLVW